MKKFKNIELALLTACMLIFSGCSNEWLDEQPLAQLSESSFWTSESDAMLALTGIYRGGNVGTDAYNNELLIMASHTDDSGHEQGAAGQLNSGDQKPGHAQVEQATCPRAHTTMFKAN